MKIPELDLQYEERLHTSYEQIVVILGEREIVAFLSLSFAIFGTELLQRAQFKEILLIPRAYIWRLYMVHVRS